MQSGTTCNDSGKVKQSRPLIALYVIHTSKTFLTQQRIVGFILVSTKELKSKIVPIYST